MNPRLLPEEEDRRKLILMTECFPEIQDKWSSCALTYICAEAGIEFRRYSRKAFRFWADEQIVWENRLLGDLDCLISDRILTETLTSECLGIGRSAYISRTLRETKTTYSEDYKRMNRIKQILEKNGIPTHRLELFLLSQFLRGLKEDDLKEFASNLGIATQDLQRYHTAALELAKIHHRIF